MCILLIILVILGETLDVLSCHSGSSSTGSGKHNHTKHHKKKPRHSVNMYWMETKAEAAAWAAWTAKYKLNNNANSGESGAMDASTANDTTMPDTWIGYGKGNAGVDPPPWATFKGQHGKPDMCYLNPEIGGCDRNMTRWGYNPYLGECAKFTYSGCGENANNFMTKAHCDVACALDVATNCEIIADEYQYSAQFP